MSGTLLGPGTEIDGFVVEAVAGRGGMGVVYRARQRRPDRVVALKVIAPELAHDEAFRARFERESSIAAQIEHPNVIPVYAIGEADGVLYIAMRFIDGTDLRTLLDARSPIEPSRAVQIVEGVGHALDAAHAKGLVHRDVKPANILLAGDHVYLTDFGLSRHVQATSGPTRTGAFMGTIDYVAPEQARGERVDARADVYSLGCVLFTALTGTVPFDLDNDLAKLYAHDRSPAPSVLARNPDLPDAFGTVLARALAKDPDERYQSAGDLGRAARAAAAGSPLPVAERIVAAGAAAPAADSSEASTVERDPPAPTRQASAPPPAADAVSQPTEFEPAAAQETEFEPAPGPASAAAQETEFEPGTVERGRGPASTPAPPKAPKPKRGRRGVLIAAAVVVLAGAGGALALSGGGDDGNGGGTPSSGDGGSPASAQTAAIPEANLTANPSFESDLANWDSFNIDLERVEADDAPDGDHVAQVSVSGSETDYAIDDMPDSVESSTSGDTYHAIAWVKAAESTDGKPVCISIRERPAGGEGDAVGLASGEVTATAGEYRPVRVSYTAQADGNRIGVHVFRDGDDVQEGEVFLVDAISLATGEPDAEASPECSL